jgi:hypothetical protein
MSNPEGKADIAAITGLIILPACRIDAVTLPPALYNAFIVSLIATTGVVKLALLGVDDPLRLENIGDAPSASSGSAKGASRNAP